jgi:cold shock CspA family protein
LQTVVKKWFRDKDYGFLDNGGGQDIMVRKAALVNCQYLKVGATVEFECHTDKQGLIAKNVKLTHQKKWMVTAMAIVAASHFALVS